jgi:hypothetical protein
MSTLTSPHDLLHAVPFFVGYHPSNSLVVISLTGDEIGFAMRIDFPQSHTGELIEKMRSHLNQEGSDAALVVLYPPVSEEGGLPANSQSENVNLIESNSPAIETFHKIHEVFLKSGINIREALLVSDGRWISLLCDDRKCCPEYGSELESIHSSRVAAEQVFNGRSFPLASRDELVAQIAPHHNHKMTSLILEEINNSTLRAETVFSTDQQKEAVKLFLDLFDEYSIHFSWDSITPHEIASLALYVRDLTIRDYFFGVALTINKSILGSFWLSAMKIMPDGFRAPFATLYASLMYETGEGAIANCALDIALTDQSEYSMATLLRRAFTAGWPPEAFDEMRKELHPRICAAIFGHMGGESPEG